MQGKFDCPQRVSVELGGYGEALLRPKPRRLGSLAIDFGFRLHVEHARVAQRITSSGCHTTFELGTSSLCPKNDVSRLRNIFVLITSALRNFTVQHALLKQQVVSQIHSTMDQAQYDAIKDNWGEVEDRDGVRLSWNIIPSSRMVSSLITMSRELG